MPILEEIFGEPQAVEGLELPLDTLLGSPEPRESNESAKQAAVLRSPADMDDDEDDEDPWESAYQAIWPEDEVM